MSIRTVVVSLCLCAASLAQSLYPVRVGNKEGFVDATGKLVIPARFDGVSTFEEGLARVELGVVRKQGSSDPSDSRYGFINAQGELEIDARFDYAHDFSEGLAVVKVKRRYGYIDKAGKLVIAARFRARVGDFHQGRAWVELDKRTFGFVDKAGKVRFRVVGADVGDPGNFADGLCRVLMQNDEVRFYDRDGKLAFTPKCAFAGGFVDGLARARTDSGWGYLDTKGNWAIEPQFDYAGSFVGAFASVSKDKKRFYIRRDGKQAFACEGLERLGTFHEGLAMVKKADVGKWGFIDETGKWVIEAKWDDPMGYGYFRGGIARVADKSRGGRWRGYIDRAGNVVWPRKQ